MGAAVNEAQLQLPLELDEIQPDAGSDHDTAPPCPLCGEPVYWGRQNQAWGRYCSSSGCKSPTRICRNCGVTYDYVNGGRTKYCSLDCMQMANGQRPRRERHLRDQAFCIAGCGRRSYNRVAEASYMCGPCAEPIRTVIMRLRAHHVHPERWFALIEDPTCEFCGVDIVTPVLDSRGDYRARLVVDHDHACCPGGTSCGKCVRGLLCDRCNLLVCHDATAERLRRAADYLERWQIQQLEKEVQ